MFTKIEQTEQRLCKKREVNVKAKQEICRTSKIFGGKSAIKNDNSVSICSISSPSFILWFLKHIVP